MRGETGLIGGTNEVDIVDFFRFTSVVGCQCDVGDAVHTFLHCAVGEGSFALEVANEGVSAVAPYDAVGVFVVGGIVEDAGVGIRVIDTASNITRNKFHLVVHDVAVDEAGVASGIHTSVNSRSGGARAGLYVVSDIHIHIKTAFSV